MTTVAATIYGSWALNAPKMRLRTEIGPNRILVYFEPTAHVCWLQMSFSPAGGGANGAPQIP